jgi:regulator of sirC expression with transglutaminase-like and TPR domain
MASRHASALSPGVPVGYNCGAEEMAMEKPHPARKAFAALVALPDEAIDLAQAALLIAREEYPDLEVGRYLGVLDEMAGTVRGRLRGGEGFGSLIAHLNRLLFDDLGFRGNREEYFDPRNSFLNDVLDRRVGIPISLSAVYLEVGRRIGCPLAGVSFPGHFLVRYMGRDAPSEVLIDPFNRGRILTAEDCPGLLRTLYDGRIEFRPEFLKRARKRDILERMLNNLKAIYRGHADFHRALRVQHLLLCVRPERPEELRDRALLYYSVACFEQAARDLQAYLDAAPDAADAGEVRKRRALLERLAPRWN